MSPYKPFRTRRGIHHFFPIRILEAIWVFFIRSSWGIKIVLSGMVCIFLGLFFPWVEIGTTDSLGAFSLLCGGIGWWTSLMMILALIVLFSYDYTEKIKKSWGVSLDPKYFYFRIGAVVFLMTAIVSVTLTGAARSLNGDIHLTTQLSGMVFTYVGAILILVGGYVIRRTEEKQSYKHVFVQGVETEDHDSYKKIL